MMYFLAFIIPLLIVIPSYVFVSAIYLKTKFADTTKIKANIRLCEILNISSFLIFSLLLPLGIISLYAGYQNLYWVTPFAVMFTIVSVVLFVIFIVSEILIRVKTGINANRKNNKGSEKAIYLTAVIGDLMLMISILCFIINWLIWDDFYVFMICSFIIFVVCYITAAILYLKRNSGKAGLKRLVVPAISFVLMFVISGYCFTHGKCGENTKWSFTIDKYLEISGSGDVNTDDLDFNLAICSLLAEDVVIWDGVESIDYSQFWQRSKLNNVYFSDSIEIINGGAFKDCTSLSLEDNGLPDNLKSIGSESFMNCDSITSVTIPDSVTEIGDGAFWGCDSLESVYIPQGITVINENTFADCDKLRKIVIPSSVKSIEIFAFYKCSNLEVYYDGSEEQWNQIFVDENYNEGLENATIHFNQQADKNSNYEDSNAENVERDPNELLIGSNTMNFDTNDYRDYWFYPPEEGFYSFTSLGEYDTRAEFIIDDTIIDEDDDSAEETNFLIVQHCYPDEPVCLRVHSMTTYISEITVDIQWEKSAFANAVKLFKHYKDNGLWIDETDVVYEVDGDGAVLETTNHAAYLRYPHDFSFVPDENAVELYFEEYDKYDNVWEYYYKIELSREFMSYFVTFEDCQSGIYVDENDMYAYTPDRSQEFVYWNESGYKKPETFTIKDDVLWLAFSMEHNTDENNTIVWYEFKG